MTKSRDPFRVVLMAGSGWTNQQQFKLIDYLREENRVLRENWAKGDYASTMTSAADCRPVPRDWEESAPRGGYDGHHPAFWVTGQTPFRSSENPFASGSKTNSLNEFQPLQLGWHPEPFSHQDWLFEIEYDGFRALAHIEQGRCKLVSRNGNEFKSFRTISESLATELKRSVVLDGEIVCLGGDGSPCSTIS